MHCWIAETHTFAGRAMDDVLRFAVATVHFGRAVVEHFRWLSTYDAAMLSMAVVMVVLVMMIVMV